MITFRKLTAESAGKLIVAYLRENQLQPSIDVRQEGDRTNVETGERLNSYYTAREGKGAWGPNLGSRITKALGVDTTQIPTDEGLARLFEAKRADSGEAWSNMGRRREISGFDFTASPDKSVTLAAEFAATQEEQALIWLAIHKANDRAMKFIANEVGVARRGSGKGAFIEAGEVAWVSFRHYIARPALQIQNGPDGATATVEVPIAGDPQAHIHNIMLNAVATETGHLGSLDSARITKITAHMFGAYFQAELAEELRNIGIAVHADDRGRAIVIDGIPQEARQLFSKRAEQAQSLAEAFVKRQGGDWNSMSADQKFEILHQANLTYRSKKYDGTNEREIWREQAAGIGWEHSTVLTDEVYAEKTDAERFEAAFEIAEKLLVEEFRTSAVIDRDAFRTHAAHGLIAAGIRSPDDVARVADMIEERGITIDGTHVGFIKRQQEGRYRVATTEQLRVEMEVARLASLSARTRDGVLSKEAIETAIASSGLDFTSEPEHGKAQLRAIYTLGLSGGLGFVTGAAGSGKTTLLKPVVSAWHADGRDVIGTAIAWRQADALKDAGIRQTFAMAPLLKRIEQGDLTLNEKTVLVVDEVSQVAPRQMLQLQELQQQYGFAIRLLGDREQGQAIEAGDTIEILKRVMPDRAQAELVSTIRQASARGRDIATRFRSSGRDMTMTEAEQQKADTARAREAIDMKRKDGTIRLAGGDHTQVVAHIADLYLRRRDALKRAGSTRGITMSAPTNADVMDISRAVRERLRERGEIGKEEIIRAAMDQRGEKYDLAISVGDRLRLYRRTSVKVDTPHGARWRDLGSNGDFVTVKGWTNEGLILENAKGRSGLTPWERLADNKTGRVLLGFGHAMTIDSAQGITSDEHINAMPRGTSAVTGFTTYVAESRHVHHGWTVISEAALREAESWSRPLGSGLIDLIVEI
ncbi:MobF family relaxase [Gluconobacter albidus]|uniref:MobF family relaxase n=1 Tax=Gluconobacter albidus TaxID=318683 RepID=UPI00309DE1E4